MIRQGEVRWVNLPNPVGSEPSKRRPVLVVQNDRANQTLIRTAIVCALTSQSRRAGAPGNVLLPTSETGLPQDSVANVSQVFTVDQSQLGPVVRTIGRRRIEEVIRGLRLFLDPSPAP